MSEGKKELPLDIFELTELMHVPEVCFELSMRMKLVKTDLQDKVETYHGRHREIFQELYINCGGGDNVYPRLYWFELAYFKQNDWGLRTMFPWPTPVFEPYRMLLPESVMIFMADASVDADKVVEMKMEYPMPHYRRLNFRFVRYSASLILGTLQDDFSQLTDMVANLDKTDAESFKKDPTLAMRLWRYLMYTKPELTESLLERFVDKFLPTVKAMEAERSLKAPAVSVTGG